MDMASAEPTQAPNMIAYRLLLYALYLGYLDNVRGQLFRFRGT